MVSALKEAIEDWGRYQLDRRINASRVDTWRHDASANATAHGFESIPWSDLIVGDVVFIREGQAFPADIVLLQSSSESGIANIETANLDGETNLKTKQASPECWRIPVMEGGSTARRNSARHSGGGGGTPGRGAYQTFSSGGGEESQGLSSRSNPKSAQEGHGLRWPLKLPPMILESSAPSRKLDGSAWKGNLTFLGPTPTAPASASSSTSHPPHGSSSAASDKIALGMDQLLLRGCVLRNTKWCIGIVLFTGVETKLMLNNRPAKIKRSHVDRIVDQCLYILFGIEFVLCSLGAILNYVWLDSNNNDFWPLQRVPDIEQESGLSWFTYLVLLDILIPISLYVSMELVKFAQAYLINTDIDMYHEATNTPAQARTSNLNEELGQVSYIFSDKTGTLTSNIMNFVSCSVDGKVYGLGKTDHNNSSDSYEPYSIPQLKGIPPVDADFPFKDTSLIRSLLNGSRARGDVALIDQFLTLLATCHTVLPDFPGCIKEHIHTYDDNCKFAVAYQAASPDEKALTIAAKNNSYYFYHREPMQIPVGGAASHSQSQSHSRDSAPPPSMLVNGEKLLVNILGVSHTFLILNSFEFTSDRARMSVILIDPRDGLIKVYTKGSDTKMYKLLSQASQHPSVWHAQDAALSEFSKFGLRTLVTGYKVITESEYLAWAATYAKAKSSIDHREERVAAAQNEIEQGLTLLGATAIEDRLQDGVPATISKLSDAGIKIWVLTGDKVDTAINIARSCALVTPKMDAVGVIEIVIDDKASDEVAMAATKAQLDAAEAKVNAIAPDLPDGDSSDSLAIVVSGAALTHIFSVVRDSKGREILYENLDATQKAKADALRTQFLRVCKKCRAVVCCRVSPNQKAEVVSLVKTKLPDLITLAIGDGANDVSMLKAAHLGIGISGLEGLQAVMASDYSIAQFRFLETLLFVHGHWSYERISKLILYSFYKNIAIAMTSIWFAIYSGFSAQLFYDPYAGSVYNIIFTSIPVMLAAVFDRDVSKKNLLKYPQLYGSGPRDECFNVRLLVRIIFEGIAHSVVLYFGCLVMFTGDGDVVKADGQTHDLWVFSTAMYSYLVIVVNGRLALDTSTFTWINHLFFVLSVLAWFAFALIYCIVMITPNMYYVSIWLFGSITFWLGFGIIPGICLLPEVAWLSYLRFWRPTLKDIVMESERGYGPAGAEDDSNVVLVRPQSPDRIISASSKRITSLGAPLIAHRPPSSGPASKRNSLIVQVASKNDDRPTSVHGGLFPNTHATTTPTATNANVVQSQTPVRADSIESIPVARSVSPPPPMIILPLQPSQPIGVVSHTHNRVPSHSPSSSASPSMFPPTGSHRSRTPSRAVGHRVSAAPAANPTSPNGISHNSSPTNNEKRRPTHGTVSRERDTSP